MPLWFSILLLLLLWPCVPALSGPPVEPVCFFFFFLNSELCIFVFFFFLYGGDFSLLFFFNIIFYYVCIPLKTCLTLGYKTTENGPGVVRARYSVLS